MPKEVKESKWEGPECMRPCFPFKTGMLVGQGPSTLNDHLISAADSLRVERAVLPPRTLFNSLSDAHQALQDLVQGCFKADFTSK